jgi:hypothetical protein
MAASHTESSKKALTRPQMREAARRSGGRATPAIVDTPPEGSSLVVIVVTCVTRQPPADKLRHAQSGLSRLFVDLVILP